MGRVAPGVAAFCAALVVAGGASPGAGVTDVPVLAGTWAITTKVLANDDATGWLGPTYEVGASNKRTWRFEQACPGANCRTDLVRITDVSQAKTRITYRGGNEFSWQENLTSTDTCGPTTFTAVSVRTNFVMKVKTLPVPAGRPFVTSLQAVGKFVATIDTSAYVKAGCRPPPARISYTIRYSGTSPVPPPARNRVYAGPARGFIPGTVKLPGKAASAVTPGQALPRGAVVDVSNGRGITLSDAKGRTSVLYGQRDGVPSIVTYAGRAQGFVELRLRGGDFAACSGPVRRLWAKGTGMFRTTARRASAAGGTWWLTEDYCTHTLVRVRKGTATVRHLGSKKTVTVRAGQSYTTAP